MSPEYVEKIMEALVMLGSKRAMVVSSLDGMDEVSISSPTKGAFYDGAKIKEMIIDPKEYGFSGKKEELIGGDAKENAKITISILDGEKSPRRDVVVLNSAVGLMVDNKVNDIKSGIEMASYLIDSGKAKRKLEEIIKISELL